MTSFETELRARLLDAAESAKITPRLERRTLMRARRYRAASAVVLGAAAGVTAVLVAVGTRGSTPLGDGDPTPPAASTPVAAGEATAVRGRCTSERLVKARDDALPPAARCAWRAPGNFDGDGVEDVVFTYGIGDEGSGYLGPAWYMRVVFDDGRKLTTRLDSSMTLGMPTTPLLAGTTDANADGRSEIFVAPETGNGATLAIYVVSRGKLQQVFEPPRPFAFSIAAGANYSAGLTCRDSRNDPALVVRTIEATDSDSLELTVTTYRWTSDTSIEQSDFTQHRVSRDARVIASLARLRCAGLDWSM